MKEFLEAGTIVNTHGIRGEVRLLCCTDSPDFLLPLKRVFIDGQPMKIQTARVHKSFLLLTLEGVESVNDAMRLKNKTVQFCREDIPLDEGQFFYDDLVGLAVKDAADGALLGEIAAVLPNPAHSILQVRGEREFLIPDVPFFVLEKNLDEGYVLVRLIEGLF